MAKEILRIEDICKCYSRGKKVLDKVSFSVNKGEVFGILGPNGAGKTTLIRVILGLLKPDSGNVYIGGTDIAKDFKMTIGRVGALVEGPAFYNYLTARDNLQIFMEYSEIKNQQRIEEVLEIVKLSDRADEKVKNYSLGMKQRLGIAQALLNHPDIIILDEPTNGLDPYGIREIRDLIKQLSLQGSTIIMSGHVLSEIEQVCTELLILNKGTEVRQIKTQQLNRANKSIYCIETGQIEALKEILNNYFKVSIESESDTYLTVDIKNHSIKEIIKKLVDTPLEINGFYLYKHNLEKYFFEVLGE